MSSISVVIPTYNGSKYIQEAIESVLNQTSLPDEIVISDDNSNDNTLEICKKYGDKIKIFKNPKGPSGFVNGWNNAIFHATGDFISILHQDDKLAPTFIEEIRQTIDFHPDVKHLFTSCQYIDFNGEIIQKKQPYLTGEIYRFSGQEYANAYIRVKGHIHRCPGVVTHKSIFEKCLYRSEAGHIADNDFFLRVGNFTDVVGILKPLAFYREHSGSETGHLDFFVINKRLLDDYHFQLKHHKENPLLSQEIIMTFKRWEAEYIHRLIVFGLKKGKFKYIEYALKKWLNFDKKRRFGNIQYDIKKIKNLIVDQIRKKHIKFLRNHKATLFNIHGKTLIIAPHPDDEVIGCGGLISRLVSQNNPPYIVIMTWGEGSHHRCCNISEEEIKSNRKNLTQKAISILGVPSDHIIELNFPDGEIPSSLNNPIFMSEITKLIETLTYILTQDHPTSHSSLNTQKSSPPCGGDTEGASIFVPHWGEGWPDHINTSKLVKEIISNSSFQIPNLNIYEYCVWMPYYNIWRGLDWKNAFRLKMTPEEHKKKLEAIDAYVTPLSPCGNPWSGVLPKLFLKANQSQSELYFKVK